MNSVKTPNLDKVIDSLKKTENNNKYKIPAIWADFSKKTGHIIVNPLDFHQNQIQKVLNFNKKSPVKKTSFPGDWIQNCVIYSCLPRYLTAFDHDDDGALGNDKNDITKSSNGWRETGSFLKTISLIPYLKNLGVNVLHLLPITPVGKIGRKGDLGSPYAISNHLSLDPNLSDPLINLDIETEFKALVEACHISGIAVIQEFVLRTSSLDNVWIKDHPNWFYWIDRNVPIRKLGSIDPNAYGPPVFDKKVLNDFKPRAENGERNNLPEPPEYFRNWFSEPPNKSEIKEDKKGFYAKINDREITVASAFADWPPDDIQPPWNDVTYLKMYNDQKDHFNYIAYNTVRMYDENLSKKENRISKLWEKIVSIIPHFQNEFGIDGAFIDMGHSMPEGLMPMVIEKCRNTNSNFTLIAEDFTPSKKQRDQGYNATVGSFWTAKDKKNWRKVVDRFKNTDQPISSLATIENHNTPRMAMRWKTQNIIREIFETNFNLRSAIPFIHAGSEFEELLPVNTGLGFTENEVKHFSNGKLPLFDRMSMKWQDKNNLTNLIASLAEKRKRKHYESS